MCTALTFSPFAKQALSGVRTVQSLSGQNREKERYAVKLREALQTGLKQARINGTGFGIVMGSFIGTYALGLWFGSWLIINERTNTITGKPFTGGDVIMCFFAVYFLFCVHVHVHVYQQQTHILNILVRGMFMSVCMLLTLVHLQIVMGSFSIGQVGPAVQAFAKGQSSAARIYDIIDRFVAPRMLRHTY